MTSADFYAEALELEESEGLLNDLKSMLRQHHNNHPRHLQKALGPSQVGHPCARNLLAGLMASPALNPQSDPLPSYIGVAAHKSMEEAAKLANEKLGRVRWLPEMRVTITPGLSGTCDLYDVDTNTVIDYKFPGPSRMTHYRKHGPNPTYYAQAHLYGKGYLNMGFPVKAVGIWFLPRGGQLASSKLWTEPYNEEVVSKTVDRYFDLIGLMDELDLEDHPERLALIPTTPHECQWCPLWSVRENDPRPTACNGKGYDPQHTDRK